MRIEKHDLHGQGAVDCEVYDMPARGGDYWDAVTTYPVMVPVTCPVPGCGQHICWYEAGYVPGYRVCMAPGRAPGTHDPRTIRHRFLAGGNAERPTLIRDVDAEEDAEEHDAE